eukprot:4345412-Amphidinium_carterae.1
MADPNVLKAGEPCPDAVPSEAEPDSIPFQNGLEGWPVLVTPGCADGYSDWGICSCFLVQNAKTTFHVKRELYFLNVAHMLASNNRVIRWRGGPLESTGSADVSCVLFYTPAATSCSIIRVYDASPASKRVSAGRT